MDVARWVIKSSRRIVVTIVGGVLLAAGLVMIVTPGPGILLIIAGLAVLGTQYAWARRALKATRDQVERLRRRRRRRKE